jgi:hypothetical protein
MTTVQLNDFLIQNTPLPPWSRIVSADLGWLYILVNGDLLKVGKTANPKQRLRAARTWLPGAKIAGVKPFWNIHEFERTLLCGIANYWFGGDWHRFPESNLAEYLISDFQMFDDHDRSKNSVDFGYWIGGSGMGELVMEQNHRRISLRRWQREA